MPVTPVATYRRRVHASLARVWENVLDWEHLPWLHRETFATVRLLEARADGWRAETALHDHRPFVVDVAIDRTRRVYHSRTVAGAGAGSDVVTTLEPVDAHTTDVAVAFLAADVPPAHADAAGAAYVALYARLWDEDEAMMRRRQAVLDAGAPSPATGAVAVPLGPAGALRATVPRVVATVAGPVRVSATDGAFVAHAVTCPHRGGPLDAAAVEDGCVVCPWHGYRFDLRTGASVGGRTDPLRPARVVVDATGDCTLVVGPDPRLRLGSGARQ